MSRMIVAEPPPVRYFDRQDVYTTEQAGRRCRVSGNTIRRWIESGYITGFKIPGSRHRRVTHEALVDFMSTHEMDHWIEGDKIRR